MAKIADMQEVSLSLLKPYERNAKIHAEAQIEKLMDSITEFGFLSPCLIERDTYNIIAGHGRVEAAKRLGMEKVPCVFVEDITEEQRRAYILADNRLTELGEWDMDMVQFELKELDAMDFDVSLTGFALEEETPEETERVGVAFNDTLSVVIECGTEEEAEEIYNELTERGLKCRISTL